MHQCNRCKKYNIPEASIAVVCSECKEKEVEVNKERKKKQDQEKIDNGTNSIFGFFKGFGK